MLQVSFLADMVLNFLQQLQNMDNKKANTELEKKLPNHLQKPNEKDS
jgi:hypothetical protein